MKRYLVTIEFRMNVTKQVDAETAEDAIEEAQNKVTLSDFNDKATVENATAEEW